MVGFDPHQPAPEYATDVQSEPIVNHSVNNTLLQGSAKKCSWSTLQQ